MNIGVYYRKLIIIALFFAVCFFSNAAENEAIIDSITAKSIQLDEVLVSTYRYNTNIRQLAAPVQIIGRQSIDNKIGRASCRERV